DMGRVIRGEEQTEDEDVEDPAPELAAHLPTQTTMVHAGADKHSNKAEDRPRRANGEAIRTPKKTDDKSCDAGHKVKEDELGRGEKGSNCRTEVEQAPEVQKEVKQAGVEKHGGDHPPPLPGHHQRPILGAEPDQHAAVYTTHRRRGVELGGSQVLGEVPSDG